MKITAYRTTMPFLDNQLSPLTNKSRPLEIDRDYERRVKLNVGNDHVSIPSDEIDYSFSAITPLYEGEMRWDRTGLGGGVPKNFVVYRVGGAPIIYKNKTMLYVMKDLKEKDIRWRIVSPTAMTASSNKIIKEAQEEKTFVSLVSKLLSSCFKVESESYKYNTVEIGSCFYVKENYALTCAHVITRKKENLSEVGTFIIDGGHKYPARVVDIDFNLDIALLYCDASKHNPISSKSIDQIVVGQNIICVGSPYGYDNNVTKGILSSKDRKVEEQKVPYFFMDLSVYPGSSGGPVVDANDGAVFGIAAVVVESVGNYGLNAGIPIDVCLDRFSKKLKEKESEDIQIKNR